MPVRPGKTDSTHRVLTALLLAIVAGTLRNDAASPSHVAEHTPQRSAQRVHAAGSDALFLPRVDVSRETGLAVRGQLGGAISAIEALENHVAVGIGPRVLIIDLTWSHGLRDHWWSPPLGGVVQGIARHGEQLLVVAGGALNTLDLSNPTLPKLRHRELLMSADDVSDDDATTALPGAVMRMIVFAERLYIGLSSGAIEVYDLGIEPADAPQPAGRYRMQGAGSVLQHIAVARGHLFALGGNELRVIDLSRPPRPTEGRSLSSHTFGSSSTRSMESDGSRLLLLNADGRMNVVDVSAPFEPNVVSSYNARAMHLSVARGLAVLGTDFGNCGASSPGRLQVVDPRDRNGPRRLHDLRPAGVPLFSQGAGGRLLVVLADCEARGELRFEIYAPASDDEPLDTIALPIVPTVIDAATIGETGYLLADDGSLSVVDLRAAPRPKRIGGWAGGDVGDRWIRRSVSSSGRLAVHGNRLLRAWGNTVAVFDIAQAAAPRAIAAIPMPVRDPGERRSTTFTAFAVHFHPNGRWAYVGYGDGATMNRGGLMVLDLTQPDRPRVHQLIERESDVSALTVEGESLYTVFGCGLAIWDVREARSPRILGETLRGELCGSRAIAVLGGRAYVSANALSILPVVFDVGQPAAISLFHMNMDSRLPLGVIRDLSVVDGRVRVTGILAPRTVGGPDQCLENCAFVATLDTRPFEPVRVARLRVIPDALQGLGLAPLPRGILLAAGESGMFTLSR